MNFLLDKPLHGASLEHEREMSEVSPDVKVRTSKGRCTHILTDAHSLAFFRHMPLLCATQATPWSVCSLAFSLWASVPSISFNLTIVRAHSTEDVHAGWIWKACPQGTLSVSCRATSAFPINSTRGIVFLQVRSPQD